MKGGTYKNSNSVLSTTSTTNPSWKPPVNKGQVKNGLCSKKNYFVKQPNYEEEYVFLSGTVRPPFARDFNLDGVT